MRIMIWVIGAMFTFGYIAGQEEYNPASLGARAIASAIVWPLILGVDIARKEARNE